MTMWTQVLSCFHCPKCGHSLEQAVGRLKAQAQMRYSGCGIAIDIDTNRLSNAVDEIRAAAEKVPPRNHDCSKFL